MKRPNRSPASVVATAAATTAFDVTKNLKVATKYVEEATDDRLNYALLLALYTLQGIPIGLSASIPFLIQQKAKRLTSSAAASAMISSPEAAMERAYRAQAVFALCSWPFSLKLLWAPVVDSLYSKRFGRRKSWFVPVQSLAGAAMVLGSGYVESQLGDSSTKDLDVTGVTAFFFGIYFLMATQDVAVDGWALTLLQKHNRPKGPVCNSVGQNIGYFLSFSGFLALNDAEISEKLWRPMLGLSSNPDRGLVSLGGFVHAMGALMLAITLLVAVFKAERPPSYLEEDDDEDEEVGIRETYARLVSICKLPVVQMLFGVLLTFRLPTALGDNVKFLKAVDFGMDRQVTALLSPTVILPLGILVPVLASRIWPTSPLAQFTSAYKFRIAMVPLVDLCMLYWVRKASSSNEGGNGATYWILVILSTALQAIVDTLQKNSLMTFFASRVDPAIGGTYMTLLNTATNLGGTWPASVVLYLVGKLTVPGGKEICDEHGQCTTTEGRDAYLPLQIILSILGVAWLVFFGPKVEQIANLDEVHWRTDEQSKRIAAALKTKKPPSSSTDSIDAETPKEKGC